MNWTISEDEQICRSWIHVSLDPVSSGRLKPAAFWSRVHKNYLKNKSIKSNKSLDSIQSRWGTIEPETLNFTGTLQQIKYIRQIDKTEQEEVISSYDSNKVFKKKINFYSCIIDGTSQDVLFYHVSEAF